MTVDDPGSNRCRVLWTPSNDERGEHKVIIKAEDTGTEVKYYSFDVTVYSWGIELVEGWNLISIPLIPTSSNIEDVFADIIDSVVYEKIDNSYTATVLQYDAIKNKWYKARPKSDKTGFTWSSSSSKLENIVPGYGYWIKMDKGDWIYGIEEDFSPSQQQLPVPSVELATESWNLVGRYSASEEPLPIGTAFESLEDYYYPKGVYAFDGINSWNSVDELELGNGYWMRTKIVPEKEIITYEPITYYFL